MKHAPAHFTLIPFFLFAFVSVLWAQAEPPMPKPGSEHQRLHYFVGDWRIEWETLPGPMGPASKERFTLKEVSPTSYTFINEISVDGGPWTQIERGKATKM